MDRHSVGQHLREQTIPVRDIVSALLLLYVKKRCGSSILCKLISNQCTDMVKNITEQVLTVFFELVELDALHQRHR